MENINTKKVLSIYVTAGFPSLNDTMPILKSLEANGVDMIELGMPYSDPLADGPTIQKSSMQAIENGMTLKVLFEQIRDLKKEISVPVLLMGYINTVMQYGFDAFCKKCEEVGISGVIIPDLPYLEYKTLYKELFMKHNLNNVFLITPQTSDERIRLLDEETTGFLYLVSTSSTTGGNKTVNDAGAYLKRVHELNLKSKTIVGFNIKDKESFNFATTYADGAIIGSAFVNHIKESKNLPESISQFIKGIR